jgi:hypothetical protein
VTQATNAESVRKSLRANNSLIQCEGRKPQPRPSTTRRVQSKQFDITASSMAPRNLSRFCERCQGIKFDETKFGAEPVRTLHGYRLDIPLARHKKYVQEGFNTRINEHLSLQAIALEDSFPNLPQLSITSLTCDFCAFLKECLLSKEVTLAVADHGVDLSSETFRIGVRLSYSWGPKRTEVEHEIGLDALYVYILNIDSNFSKDKAGAPSLGQDVFCIVRYTIFSSPGPLAEC